LRILGCRVYLEVQVAEGKGPEENENRHVQDVFADEYETNFAWDTGSGKPTEGINARIQGYQYESHKLEGSNNAKNFRGIYKLKAY
jgi:hypothetical protein